MSATEAEVDVNLDTITELDTKIQTLDHVHKHDTLTLLDTDEDSGEDSSDDEEKETKIVHDLAPVHAVLVELAANLQCKVDKAIRDLQQIRVKLSNEL